MLGVLGVLAALLLGYAGLSDQPTRNHSDLGVPTDYRVRNVT
jgi:hypothetical protein